MAEKVTIMVIKVDLQCDRCYRKIRKVLCKFPEIRDQVYDEKQNTVKITVVSCCPERILKKIWSKGGKSVDKIEIVQLGDKKKEPEKKEAEKKKDQGGGGGDKAKDGAGGDKKKDEPEKKGKEGEQKKKDGGGGGEKAAAAKEPEKKKEGEDKPKEKEPEKKPKEAVPVPVSGYPSIFPPVYPVQAYYDPYQQYQVHAGGPMPGPRYQCHQMPNHYPAYDNHRANYYGNQYDYFSEENPSSCSVM